MSIPIQTTYASKTLTAITQTVNNHKVKIAKWFQIRIISNKYLAFGTGDMNDLQLGKRFIQLQHLQMELPYLTRNLMKDVKDVRVRGEQHLKIVIKEIEFITLVGAISSGSSSDERWQAVQSLLVRHRNAATVDRSNITWRTTSERHERKTTARYRYRVKKEGKYLPPAMNGLCTELAGKEEDSNLRLKTNDRSPKDKEGKGMEFGLGLGLGLGLTLVCRKGRANGWAIVSLSISARLLVLSKTRRTGIE